MENRKRFWWLGAIITFGLFYFIIPPVVYNSAPFLISLIGALILTFFVIQALWDFKSFQSFNKPKPEEVTAGHKYAPFMVFLGIMMIFVFYLHSTNVKKEEVQKDGIITSAIVLDGESKTSTRSSSYSLKIKYTTKEGKTYVTKESVSSSEFNNVYKGMEISVIYSRKDPELVELIISDEDINKYLGISNRNLTLSDLFKLYDITEDSIAAYLNKISYKWVVEKDSFRTIWHNTSKDEAIVRHFIGTLAYVSRNRNEPFVSEIRERGFHKIQKDSTGTEIYENDTYRISSSSELKTEEGKLGISVINVIEILKLTDPNNFLNQLKMSKIKAKK